MATFLPNGLYDNLVTDDLTQQVSQYRADQLTLSYLGAQAAPQRLVDALCEQLEHILRGLHGNRGDSLHQAPQDPSVKSLQ
jgi:hypothetical protein